MREWVVSLAVAENSNGFLVSRLRGINQPVVSSSNQIFLLSVEYDLDYR